MDVKSLLMLGLCLILTMGCEKKKTTDSVFSEDSNNKTLGNCSTASWIHNEFLVKWSDGRITVETAKDSEEFKASFLKENLDQIEHVEFNKRIELIQSDENQFQVEATPTENWGTEKVRAQVLWNQNIKGQGVTVAVIDTAVDYYHSQINPRLAINLAEQNGVTGVDDDGNGYIDDISGWDFVSNKAMATDFTAIHGTHVAGVVAADHGAGAQRGVAPQAQILPISFLNAQGAGDLGGAIKAIQYAAKMGARVINASWGIMGGCSETLKENIEALAAQNILFVAASGNDGVDFDRYSSRYWTFPAGFNLLNQITVAAMNVNDYLTGFSNTSFSLVHIAAPGESIWSATPSQSYAYLDGTSMATPFVAGAAALLISAKPTATYAEVKSAILKSARSADGKAYKVSTGGYLDIPEALDYLLSH